MNIKKRVKQTLLFILSLSIIFLSFGSPSASAVEKKPIKIGVLLAQTGPFASLTKYTIEGFKVAMEAAGYKVAGRPIKVIYADSGPGDPSFAMNKLRMLVESDKIDILVGPFNSDLRLATLSYTSKRKIPSFAVVCADQASLTFPYSYAWDQTTFQEGVPFGWYAYDKLGIRTVDAVGGDWHAGRAFIAGFIQGFTKDRKGKVIQEQYPPVGTTDFSSYIVALKPADAIVLMDLPADTAAYISQAHDMGALKKKKLLNMGQSIITPMLKGLGPKLIGNTWQEAETQPDFKDPASQKFIKLFTAKYGHPPENLEGCGYTTALVILHALEATHGNTNPDKLHKAIKALAIHTPLGKLTFTKGNPNKSGVEGIITRFMEVVKKRPNGEYYWALAYHYDHVKPEAVKK